MIEANVNYMDAVIIGIMLISCLVAFIRGFMREILALGAWVAAGVITLYSFPYVAEILKTKISSDTVATGLAALGTYMIALILLSIINRVLVKYAKSGADVGMLDNFLGLFFGALRGAFIVSLGFFLLTYVMDKDKYPDWIETAHTKPYAEEGAKLLARMAPHYLEEMSSLAKEKGEQMREEKDSESTGGYNDTARDRMNQMFGGASSVPETIDDTDENKAKVHYQ